jgi:hypothetical protein
MSETSARTARSRARLAAPRRCRRAGRRSRLRTRRQRACPWSSCSATGAASRSVPRRPAAVRLAGHRRRSRHVGRIGKLARLAPGGHRPKSTVLAAVHRDPHTLLAQAGKLISPSPPSAHRGRTVRRRHPHPARGRQCAVLADLLAQATPGSGESVRSKAEQELERHRGLLSLLERTQPSRGPTGRLPPPRETKRPRRERDCNRRNAATRSAPATSLLLVPTTRPPLVRSTHAVGAAKILLFIRGESRR